MMAQAQKVSSSSVVRSRRLPVVGSTAHTRGVSRRSLAGTGRCQRWPSTSKSWPALTMLAACRRRLAAFSRSFAILTRSGSTGQAFAGALVHAGLAVLVDLALPDHEVAVADGTGCNPRSPAGGFLQRPLGDVLIERSDRGQLVV